MPDETSPDSMSIASGEVVLPVEVSAYNFGLRALVNLTVRRTRGFRVARDGWSRVAVWIPLRGTGQRDGDLGLGQQLLVKVVFATVVRKHQDAHASQARR